MAIDVAHRLAVEALHIAVAARIEARHVHLERVAHGTVHRRAKVEALVAAGLDLNAAAELVTGRASADEDGAATPVAAEPRALRATPHLARFQADEVEHADDAERKIYTVATQAHRKRPGKGKSDAA